ncbi:MAG: hypothetical protein M3P38_13340 [Chloroflexota bacterium]|nr:hypothetical protein [Chloroflexota bacterium]
MIQSRRLQQIYTGAAIALLLLASMLNGYVLLTVALAVLVAGLVIFPDLRRVGIKAAIVAFAVAAAVVLIRSVS